MASHCPGNAARDSHATLTRDRPNLVFNPQVSAMQQRLEAANAAAARADAELRDYKGRWGPGNLRLCLRLLGTHDRACARVGEEGVSATPHSHSHPLHLLRGRRAAALLRAKDTELAEVRREAGAAAAGGAAASAAVELEATRQLLSEVGSWVLSPSAMSGFLAGRTD